MLPPAREGRLIMVYCCTSVTSRVVKWVHGPPDVAVTEDGALLVGTCARPSQSRRDEAALSMRRAVGSRHERRWTVTDGLVTLAHPVKDRQSSWRGHEERSSSVQRLIGSIRSLMNHCHLCPVRRNLLVVFRFKLYCIHNKTFFSAVWSCFV